MRFDLRAHHLPRIPPLPECIELAQNMTAPSSAPRRTPQPSWRTSEVCFATAMAPRVTLHGVLVEVYGEGLLIMGGLRRRQEMRRLLEIS